MAARKSRGSGKPKKAAVSKGRAARGRTASRSKSKGGEGASKAATSKSAKGVNLWKRTLGAMAGSALKSGDYHVMCYGGHPARPGEVDGSCCPVWNAIPLGPGIGARLVQALEAAGHGGKLTAHDKDVIRAWPEHDLHAVVGAIQAACRSSSLVDPALDKVRAGAQPVVALISSDAPAGTRMLRVLFFHPSFDA